MNEKLVYLSIQNVLSFSVAYLKYDLESIFLWGFSIGSCPTIETASKFQNLGGILLQSPLASAHIWLDNTVSWEDEFDSNDMFSNINKIEHISSKIIMYHGKSDQIIDVRHSILLYERYEKMSKFNNIRLYTVNDTGHNDLQEIILDFESPLYQYTKDFIYNPNHSINNIFNYKKSIWNHDQEQKSKLLYLEKEIKSLEVWLRDIEVIGQRRKN